MLLRQEAGPYSARKNRKIDVIETAKVAHNKWLKEKTYQYDPSSGLFSTYEKTDSWYMLFNYEPKM